MAKAIGALLVLYGIAGLVGAYLAHRWIKGPIRDLRALLRELSVRLGEGGAAAKQVGAVLTDQARPTLKDIAKNLKQVAELVGSVALRFGTVAGVFQAVRDRLDSVVVPTPVAVWDTLPLTVTLPLLKRIEFTEYHVPVVGKVYGPPMSPKFEPVTLLDLGDVEVVKGIDTEDGRPLRPAAELFRGAADRIQDVHDQLAETERRVDEARGFIDDQAVPALDDAVVRLDQLGAELDGARAQALDIGESKLLSVAPVVVIGYFGLIHLAFALTGLALLLV